jgi:hypothetical protein
MEIKIDRCKLLDKCPLQDCEFGVCKTDENIKCPSIIPITRRPLAKSRYAIPKECPLMSGPVVIYTDKRKTKKGGS